MTTKNILRITTYFISTTILCSCSGYTKKDGKVYLRSSSEAHFGVKYSELDSTDYESFEVIDNDINSDLAKDKYHVFHGTYILKGADPNTFKQVRNYFWKDKNYIFLVRYGKSDCQINQADPTSFKALDNNLWASDRNNIYYGFDKLNNVNLKSFVPIDEDWGKDNKNCFWHNDMLDSIDINSIKVLSHDYIKDNRKVYYHDKIVINCDPNSFIPDGVGSFGHDKKFMYEGDSNTGAITEKYRKIYLK